MKEQYTYHETQIPKPKFSWLRLSISLSFLFGSINQGEIISPTEIQATNTRNNPGKTLFDPNLSFLAIGEPDFSRINTTANSVISPNDPLYPDQWNLQSPELFGTGWTNLWQRVKENPPPDGKDIVVAILDSGSNFDHPELKDVFWTNPDEIPGNGIDDDLDGCVDNISGINVTSDGACNNPFDDTLTQHGTGTLGVMAAHTDNGIGISADLSGNRVKYIIIKVIMNSGIANYSDITKGFQFALNNHADIVVMDFAGRPISQLPVANNLLQMLYKSGAILLAGAGNDGDTHDTLSWPASKPEVIATSGYSRQGNRISNYAFGPGLEVITPGVDIHTTCYDGSLWSDYCIQSGTSFTAPQVAMAAIIAKLYRPNITPDEFRNLLRVTSGEPWTPERGYGQLRLDRIGQQLGLNFHQYLPAIQKP